MSRKNTSKVGSNTKTYNHSAALLAAVCGLAVASAAHGQNIFWNGATTNWNNLANWTPNNVPNTTAENPMFTAGGSYTATMDASFSIGSLTMSNPAGLLQTANGTTLAVLSGISNDSTITINSTAGGSGTLMQLLASQPVSGSGAIVLNAAAGNLDTAYLYFNGGGEVLTNGATHTIRGTGNVYVNMANNGTVNANVSGRTLQLFSQPKSNTNLMTATGGGTLAVSGITVTQTGAGRIVADGGTVTYGGSTVNGGAVTTQNGGVSQVSGNSAFSGVTFTGPTGVLNGSVMRINTTGNTINNGTITVNTVSGVSATYIQSIASGSISGTGTILLNATTNLDTAYLYFNGGGEVLTQAAGHTIRGTGNIYVNMVNNGLINADQNGRILHLNSQPKTNNNLMQATNGGFLDINVGITQGGSGQILGNAARVRLGSASVSGGTVTATGSGGLIEINGVTDFNNVAFSGPMEINNGTGLRTTSGFTNNGTITINPTSGGSVTYLQALATSTIGGTGTIVLNATSNLDTAYLTYNGGGEVLTLSSGQTVRGTGRVYVNTINNGLINADQNAKILHLNAIPKTNNNIMKATNGAFLDITVPVTQAAAGQIIGDGGVVRTSSASITNGAVTAMNAGGLIEVAGTTDFNGVTLTGPLQVDNTAFLRTTSGFTNNGTITINSGVGGGVTVLQALASTTIAGTGTIVLNATSNLDTSYLTYNGGGEVMTLSSGQTVRGTGRIYVNALNNGVINADVNGKIIHLIGVPKTNNNIMKATNSAFLDITVPVTQGASGQIIGDGGTVRTASASITNGAVKAMNAGGLIEVTGTTDFNGITLTGPLQVDNGAAMRTTSGLTNNGTITINPTAGGAGTYFQALATCSIGGTGTIRLNAAPANLLTSYLTYNGGGEVLTLGPGQTLIGLGQVYVRLTNQGRISPGVGVGGIGQIDTRQLLTHATGGLLDMEVGGTNPADFDRITGVGTIALAGGTLRVTAVNGFSPTPGQTFQIIGGPAITGTFCETILPVGWAVVYGANSITMEYTGCVGDTDNGSGCGIPDAGVTIDDLLFYLAIFDNGDIRADVDDGSFTGFRDGGVTIDDLLYYLFRFDTGC